MIKLTLHGIDYNRKYTKYTKVAALLASSSLYCCPTLCFSMTVNRKTRTMYLPNAQAKLDKSLKTKDLIAGTIFSQPLGFFVTQNLTPLKSSEITTCPPCSDRSQPWTCLAWIDPPSASMPTVPLPVFVEIFLH